MFYSSLLTTCLTMGNRPEELRETLSSLGNVLSDIPVLAINDFGDAESTAVFREMCPHGRVIDTRGSVGHMRAIDALYGHVQTPYIFHMEDDWTFTRTDFFEDALNVLTSDDKISMVLLRDLGNIPLAKQNPDKVLHKTTRGIDWARLDGTCDKWFGYTFNPHLSRRETWLDLGGFSQFRGEGVISQHFRDIGRYVAALTPGPCYHAGAQHSVRKLKRRQALGKADETGTNATAA